MAIALVTGSAGLIGGEAVRYFSQQGHTVVGIDNDMHRYFFGAEASTDWSLRQLQETVPQYHHYAADIRDAQAVEPIFAEDGSDIRVVIHTACSWTIPRRESSCTSTGRTSVQQSRPEETRGRRP
jgi:CDP-paratose 2-epimerase